MAVIFKKQIGIPGNSTGSHISLSGQGIYIVPPFPPGGFVVLYNEAPINLTTVLTTITANGHILQIDRAYHGQLMATSTANQATTLFTFSSAVTATNHTLSTYDIAIGPEWFRHRVLGYK